MHLIAVIGFIAFGVLALTIAIWHEFTWWKRRNWIKGKGAVVGFSESYNDGVSYHPEIEFLGAGKPVRFISIYGSAKKPDIGKSVNVLIDESGNLAEEITTSNRIAFTIFPILLGLVFIVVGINVQPIEPAEQDGAGQPATRSESKSDGNENPNPETEGRSR